MKQLWVLAGGNGSGKSTFYRTQLQPLGLAFVNADQIAKEVYPDAPELHSYEAASIAENLRMQLLSNGRSFCFETVYSHPSKIDFVAKAKALGYQVVLVFIHLDNTMLNKARISQRVKEGGHFVPDSKVESRIPRTLQHVLHTVPLCDELWVLDNSNTNFPFRTVLRMKGGEIHEQSAHVPNWAKAFLK